MIMNYKTLLQLQILTGQYLHINLLITQVLVKYTRLGDLHLCVSTEVYVVILHSLSFCDVTDEGRAALDSALRSNPTHLKDLYLSGNNLKH